jgi:hypothetical protein
MDTEIIFSTANLKEIVTGFVLCYTYESAEKTNQRAKLTDYLSFEHKCRRLLKSHCQTDASEKIKIECRIVYKIHPVIRISDR